MAGDTVTAWVFISTPQTFQPLDFFLIDTWGPSGAGDNSPLAIGSGILTNTWFQVTDQLVSGVSVDHIGFRLSLTSNFAATMFLDDVVITGP